MLDMLDILLVPLAACVVLAGIHCYLGMHVVMRGVIFVDLALAQIAAMGAGVATLFDLDPHSTPAHAFALGFAFVGSAVFALGRFRERRIPQEAIIGIVYAVSSALAILILSKSAVEREEIEHMLVGRLLFVDWPEIGATALIYVAVGLIHFLWRRRFFTISASPEEPPQSAVNVRLWDFVFYATLGVVVTRSVPMAGVLLVFSFLVVPAVCAMMFFTRVGRRLLAGWGFGLLASVAGLAASAQWDFPTGASIVAAFGAVLICCAAVYGVRARLRPRSGA